MLHKDLKGINMLRHEIFRLVNDLYQNEVSLFNNHFMPNFKLISKHREGSKIIKKHDKPQTPYQRVMASKHIDRSIKIKLAVVHKQLVAYIQDTRIL